MFRNTRLPSVVVLLIALAAILGLACPRAEAKPVPFKITGGGPAPHGLSLLGTPSLHEATGTATHLGKYSGEGHVIVDDFPTANNFHGSFVFVAANGDKLGCTYKGTYELSGAVDEAVVVFTATFTMVKATSTGRFANATGSFVMVATTEPIDLTASVDGVTPAFDYTWEGVGSIDLDKK